MYNSKHPKLYKAAGERIYNVSDNLWLFLAREGFNINQVVLLSRNLDSWHHNV